MSTPTDYPEGFDTEVFTFASLERAWREAKLPSEREHVTPYIRNHPELFAYETWTDGTEDNSKLHLSVDTEQDFKLVSAIYDRLYDEKRIFDMNDILNFLKENPQLLEMNRGATGYEGYEKSLREDEEYKKNHV